MTPDTQHRCVCPSSTRRRDVLRVIACCGLLGALAWSTSSSAAGTIVGGGNIVNQTWGPAGSPYTVLGDAIVPAGSTLTITAGTVVLFASADGQASGVDPGRVELTVNGSLHADGTPGAEVTFAAAAGPVAGSWYGIVVHSNDVHLSHVALSDAVRGLTVAASPPVLVEIDSSSFSDTSLADLELPGDSPVLSGTIALSKVEGSLDVPAAARLRPAGSPGLLAVDGDLTLGGLDVALLDSGSFDRVDVSGTVTLGGGELMLDASLLSASIGDAFELIADDGTDPISGTFAGLPEQAVFEAGAFDFRITYAGGVDGNDVVLTVVPEAPAPEGAATALLLLVARWCRRDRGV
jgi:hypothetical protein